MIKHVSIFVFIAIAIALLVSFISYWVNTQPVGIISRKIDISKYHEELPSRNRQVIEFVEANGVNLAPDYQQVKCTDFVVRVIERFVPLSKGERNQINIVTNDDLNTLIENESAIIKGVQTSLIQGRKGIEIIGLEDVRPGDFVQFWNEYLGTPYGHCGVIFDVEPYHSISLYSSHPLTHGYGKQKYMWPDKVYFVRLK
ncbi:hypothetical protein [Ohtaekwangia koreensis]|uniref:CHAP domain-containing protein n=1 Tax=Ohtaekwangia koreensis TaxID=688867 RepID=A0A1T5K176_9BACT|nr:hypothetical protein [Ohtaekwangia koreensis]SKC57229.1 hypothetical protein SAMN05660236_1683 [Ohtaekwangia koreensis]